MPSYQELADLARLCWRLAAQTSADDVAQELRRMAREYQQQAAKLDGGKLPKLEGDGDDTPQV
jgi:hypothetical protein